MFVIIMMILVGRYCVGFRVTIRNVDSDANIAMTEMIRDDFEVNAAVEQKRCIAVPELMQRQILELCAACKAFERSIHGVSVPVISLG